MTRAICWNCGEWKFGALTACKHCGARPDNEEDVMASMLLTDRQSSDSELKGFAAAIKSGKWIRVVAPVGSEARGAARKALQITGRYRPSHSDSSNQQHREPSLFAEATHKTPPTSVPSVGNSDYTESAQIPNDAASPSGSFSLSGLLGSLFWMILSGLMILAMGYYTRNTVALVTHGVETTGVIQSYEPHKCGSRKRRRTCHDHTIVVQGLGTISVDLFSPYEVGSTTYLTYEEGNSSNVHPGRRPTFGTLDALQYGAIALLFLLCAFFVICWNGVVVSLGARSPVVRVVSYSASLALVGGLYLWVTAQFLGVTELEVVRLVLSSLRVAL